MFLCTGADWQILQNADLVTLLGHFTHGKTRKTQFLVKKTASSLGNDWNLPIIGHFLHGKTLFTHFSV